jgi:transcriptional regulator with XRE-family HTH domain
VNIPGSNSAKKKAREQWRQTAGAVIAHTRRDSDVTQEDLAKRLGVSVDTIGAIETGRRKVEVGDLIEAAKALNVDPLKLLKRILAW